MQPFLCISGFEINFLGILLYNMIGKIKESNLKKY